MLKLSQVVREKLLKPAPDIEAMVSAGAWWCLQVTRRHGNWRMPIRRFTVWEESRKDAFGEVQTWWDEIEFDFIGDPWPESVVVDGSVFQMQIVGSDGNDLGVGFEFLGRDVRWWHGRRDEWDMFSIKAKVERFGPLGCLDYEKF